MLVAMLAQEMLEEAGCAVTLVGTVEKALRLLATDEAFDAALVDLNLHGTPGFPVADALAAKCIPFAFATGYGADYLPAAYRGQPVLTKPYDDKRLQGMLAGLLGGKEAQ